MKDLVYKRIVEQPEEAEKHDEIRKQIELEAPKFTEIKIFKEDAENLERCSEELDMDPSEIIHRLLFWHDCFMKYEWRANK